jgi:tetratricopeptide (TPR) repeat protein
MMKFAKSSQHRRRRSAILSLAAMALAVAWTSPSYGFDFWNWNDKSKKCPSGKAWNDQKRKCVALKSGSLSDEDLARAGRQLARDGHYREAIKVLETVANKDDSVVLTYLGYSHRKLGQIDLGISLYKKALDIDPENVDTREYLGEGYVSKGELDLAWLELSEIEKRCGTTCEEYQALEKVLRSSRSEY